MTVVPSDPRRSSLASAPMMDILTDLKTITGNQVRISQLLHAAIDDLQSITHRLARELSGRPTPIAEPAPKKRWWRFFSRGTPEARP